MRGQRYFAWGRCTKGGHTSITQQKLEQKQKKSGKFKQPLCPFEIGIRNLRDQLLHRQ